MVFQLKKLSAFLLMLLFFLPTVSKLGHDYIHKDEVHCNADGLHFHQTPHHCSIDEFVPSVENIPPAPFAILPPRLVLFERTIAYKAPHLQQHNVSSIALRGPPQQH